ncbi:MAG: hypothetical protein LBR20_08225 [Propionibacteriaceae bacterium]|nr:hypothetical protein [Propionibacteriaceae bacterium]
MTAGAIVDVKGKLSQLNEALTPIASLLSGCGVLLDEVRGVCQAKPTPLAVGTLVIAITPKSAAVADGLGVKTPNEAATKTIDKDTLSVRRRMMAPPYFIFTRTSSPGFLPAY